jgi:hypothetical protein
LNYAHATLSVRFCIHQYASDQGHEHSRSRHAPAGQSPGKRYTAHGVQAGTPRGEDVEQGFTTEFEGERTGVDTTGQGEYFTVAASAASASSSRTRRLSDSSSFDPLNSHSPAFSTFIGLLFHALADGISLGAASSFPSSSSGVAVERDGASDSTAGLSVLIFLSLLIHKAPVAFSLSTLLLSYAPSSSLHTSYKSQIRKALLWFALATPVGAIVTWVLLKTITLISWSESLNEGAEEDGNVNGIFAGSMRGRLEFWSESQPDFSWMGQLPKEDAENNCSVCSWHSAALLRWHFPLCVHTRDGRYGVLVASN